MRPARAERGPPVPAPNVVYSWDANPTEIHHSRTPQSQADPHPAAGPPRRRRHALPRRRARRSEPPLGAAADRRRQAPRPRARRVSVRRARRGAHRRVLQPSARAPRRGPHGSPSAIAGPDLPHGVRAGRRGGDVEGTRAGGSAACPGTPGHTLQFLAITNNLKNPQLSRRHYQFRQCQGEGASGIINVYLTKMDRCCGVWLLELDSQLGGLADLLEAHDDLTIWNDRLAIVRSSCASTRQAWPRPPTIRGLTPRAASEPQTKGACHERAYHLTWQSTLGLMADGASSPSCTIVQRFPTARARNHRGGRRVKPRRTRLLRFA